MNETIPNISFKKPNRNPTLDSDSSMYELPFYKDREYMGNVDNFVKFINAVKAMVRSSQDYKDYIAYLKGDLGLSACQVLSNVEDDFDSKDRSATLIEMHHGPILTIFDIIAIITDHLIYEGKQVTTFMVADIVIQEHFENNVQVVMLSETVHEEVHNNNIFINLKQAFGDLNRFLAKYNKGLNQQQVNNINAYIEKSKQFESFDNDVLKLQGFVKNWSPF